MAATDGITSTTTPDFQFQTVSARQLSKRIGVSYRLALRLVYGGAIPSVACGARRRVAVDSIARWLGVRASAGPC